MRILLVVFLLGKLTVCLASVENDMLKAYQEQNFTRARRLAKKIPDNPKAKFVRALLLIYNSKDYAEGLTSLKELYQDKTLPKPIWLQVSLAYARVVQLMEKRPEVYGTLADGVNSVEIYQEIINTAPKSRMACTAMLFKVADDLLSGDGQKERDTFSELENFCKNYKGSKQFLTPLHLLAEDRYIVLRKDYKSAMRHLKTAYKSGVVNPKDRAVVLYRIGRMYDMKLKNKTEAVKYYSEFLQQYPYSDNAPSVKRFLNKINSTLTRSRQMSKDDNNNKKMFQNIGLIMAGLFYIVSCVMVYINTTGGAMLNSDIKTITFAHWQLEDGFREGYAEAIKQFEEYKASQGQKVKVVQTTVPWRGYNQWFLTQLIGGDPADVIELKGSSSLRNQYFIPLSRYIGAPNPFNTGTPMSGVPWKDTFIDNMNGALDSSFGEYFGIGAFTGTYRVYVNIDLLEKATGSRKLPKTLKQWMDACDKMRGYGEKIGKAIIPIGVRGFDKGTLNYLFQNYFSQINSDINDKISQNCSPGLSTYDVWQQLAKNKLDKDKLLAAVDIVREIGQNFGAGFMATDLEQTKFLFFSGKVGFFPEGTWNAYSMVKNAPFEVAIMPLPIIGQDHKYSKYFVGAPTEQGARVGCLFGIPKASKNFDLALEFLQFVSSWKINNMIMVDYCKWLPSCERGSI